MTSRFHALGTTLAVSGIAVVAYGQQSASPPDTLGQRWTYDSRALHYTAEVVGVGLEVPFAIAFLPDGRALISDRAAGQLVTLDLGSGRTTPVSGGPAVFDSVDAGLLDVIVHPDFTRYNLVYYAFSEKSDTGLTTVVERARLRGNQLTGRTKLFAAYPALKSLNHFGARLALRNGYLFITLGERDIRELAQELWTDHGKIIRLFEDGRIPPDNPFVGRAGARPGIWSYGHRNPHGLAFRPETGELWETEHGPLGGDEVNIIRRAANYGWPLATFGREYDGGPVDGARDSVAGTESPVYHYSASAALSGMMFYDGAAFPEWRGNLFVGAMTPRYLGRIILEPGREPREERLLTERQWRIRAIQTGLDGLIYLGIERSRAGAKDGMIVRLRPADSRSR